MYVGQRGEQLYRFMFLQYFCGLKKDRCNAEQATPIYLDEVLALACAPVARGPWLSTRRVSPMKQLEQNIFPTGFDDWLQGFLPLKPAMFPRSLAEVAELHKSKFSGVPRLRLFSRRRGDPQPCIDTEFALATSLRQASHVSRQFHLVESQLLQTFHKSQATSPLLQAGPISSNISSQGIMIF